MAWDPWRALEERPHIVLAVHPIAELGGGAFYARRGERAVIALHPALTGPERRAALAHELVHDERGPLPAGATRTPGLAVLSHRDEEAVWRTVADRLVPADQLAAFVRRSVAAGEGVGPAQVAERFDVPVALAERALVALARRWGP